MQTVDPNAKTISREQAIEVAGRRGFPARHIAELTQPDFQIKPEVKATVDHARGLLLSHGFVIVQSPIGNGKTMAGTMLGVEYAQNRRRAHYWTVKGLMSDQKMWFSLQGDRPESPFKIAQTCKLLVVDELHANSGTAFDHSGLSNIIDARYRDLRPTIVLTNIQTQNLRQVLQDHIVDRVLDGGGLIEMTGKSLRGQR